MTSRDAAAGYLARGWAPIPVPWRSKDPGIKDWPKLRVTDENVGQYFNGTNQNIGILLGEPSGGLTDIDLDCPEAVIAARHLLPDTGCVFGRAGNPRSHHLFIAPSVKTRKLTAPDGEVLLELRATGIQTVFPPSTHPSGEAIEWLSDNGPAQIEGARLTRIVGLVAAAALIARRWPTHGRHDATLALAGALRRANWTLDQATLFVRAVAEAAHDEEARDRERAVADTYARDGTTTGWPRIGELLGRDVVGRLQDWVGAQGPADDRVPADRDPGRPNEPPSYPAIPPLDALRIDPAELDSARLTPTCIVEAYLFADGGLLAAPGGTGKTTLYLYEGAHIAIARPLYGLTVHTPGSVVLVTAEDRRELLIARLGRIMEAMDLSAEERATVCARVLIWDVSGAVCRLAELDRRGNVVLTGLADSIVERFRDAPPVMVGFDPVVSFGAGERIVNDNEQALITAARRIVRGLGCCVRLIAHTGKEAARAGALDQYASRGGSALSDGARLVAVLRSWDPEATDDKLSPPPGLSFGTDEQVIVLARPKLSYAPPQPLIWLKRCGYAFEHFISTKPDPEAEALAQSEQVERYLATQLALGSMHSQKTLEDAGIMPRAKLRKALSSLISCGRIVYAPLPEELRHGGRKDYLHPSSATSPNAEGFRGDVGQKNAPSSPSPETVSTSPPPYREKNGGEVPAANFSLPTYHFASEARRGRGEVGEVGGDEAQPMAEIRGWLQEIGEDRETIDEVLETCATDPAVMDGYLRSAREVPS